LNTAISFQRKESRHRYTIGYDGAIFQIPDSVATDPELKLQIKQLYAAIDNLNNIDKAILLLYLEGNSYKEIAEIIGTSETNIGTKINRLKQKMKNTMN
jgi:RNA polymerase sigma-70 factor (ECF subfamily)